MVSIMSPFRGYAVNNVHKVDLEPRCTLFAEPQLLASVDLREAESTDIAGQVRFVASRSGLVHGIGGWFSSRLSPNVICSNGVPNKVSWRHAFFPLDHPLEVESGTALVAAIRSGANGEMWSWGMNSDRGGDGSVAPARVTQSTLWGFPIGNGGVARDGSRSPHRTLIGQMASTAVPDSPPAALASPSISLGRGRYATTCRGGASATRFLVTVSSRRPRSPPPASSRLRRETSTSYHFGCRTQASD